MRDLELQRSLLKILEEAARPLSIGKLTGMLGLASHAKRTVRRLVKDLVFQGKVLSEGRGRYSAGRQAKEVTGKLGNPRGRYFPVLSEDQTVLMQVSAQQLNGALAGDVVVAEAMSGPEARARIANKGRVVKLVKPGKRMIVGVFHRIAKACFVTPENERFCPPVFIKNQSDYLDDDEKLVAVYVDVPDATGKLKGEIFRVLGAQGDLETELERLLLEYGLEIDFPADVASSSGSTRELAMEFDDMAKDNRLDLRHLPHVTIDPDDAKDFDDAVFVESTGRGWRLWVSIADVSAFVPVGSNMDLEAARRGCSTYLPARVIPMLPQVLSEDICSLSPRKDKAAITVEMEVSKDGRVSGGRVMRTLIRSVARLTYEQVQAVLDGKHGNPVDLMQVETMAGCAKALLNRMKMRGQILFDLPEIHFSIGHEGQVIDAGAVPHGLANRMIEAFMVAANEAVGRLLERLAVPALYRIHEQPDTKKMKEFIFTATALGCKPDFGYEPEPVHVAAFLRSIEDRPVGPALSQLLLKSLMQAKYSEEPKKHFGLATDRYLHFTSPIRRYPDLVIHRQLAALLDSVEEQGLDLRCSKPAVARWPLSIDRVRQLAESCSRAERRSIAAERAAASLYQAAWAQEREGLEFDSVVTGASDIGLFVRLRPSMVEGLIHISRLSGGYYDYDPQRLALVARRSGKTFRVGQEFRVRIVSSDLVKRRVDLELA